MHSEKFPKCIWRTPYVWMTCLGASHIHLFPCEWVIWIYHGHTTIWFVILTNFFNFGYYCMTFRLWAIYYGLTHVYFALLHEILLPFWIILNFFMGACMMLVGVGNKLINYYTLSLQGQIIIRSLIKSAWFLTPHAIKFLILTV